jgi:hypothetical protein
MNTATMNPPNTAHTPTQRLRNEPTCRICGQQKQRHLFVCPACWEKLPHEMRLPFTVQRLKCLQWLRVNTGAWKNDVFASLEVNKRATH